MANSYFQEFKPLVQGSCKICASEYTFVHGAENQNHKAETSEVYAAYQHKRCIREINLIQGNIKERNKERESCMWKAETTGQQIMSVTATA